MNPYDVQPHPTIPGAYQASFGGGPPITVTGQPAQDLIARQGGPKVASMNLDALKAMRGASPEQARAIAAANPIAVNGQAASQGIADPRVQQASAQGVGPQAATQQPMPAQQQAQPGPRVGQSLNYTMKAIDPATGKEVEGEAIMTPDGPRVRIAGSRGSPGGLTGFGKQKTAHETETEQKIAEARVQQDKANEEAQAAARGQAEAELTFRKEQEQQAANQANDQASEVEQTKKRVADLDAKYQQARDAANDQHVDAGRYMRGNWLAALGAALGAAGAAIGKHPNFAGDFINQNIDRDIRSQEKEIEIKGRSADNALADLVREQGSLKDGKLALRQILVEKAGNKAASIAAQYKGQAIGAAAQQAAAQAMEQHAMLDQERKQSYLDRTLHDRTYYSPGSAGRAGGLAVPTMGSMRGKQEGEVTGRELALKEREAAQGGKNASAVASERTDKIAALASGIVAANTIDAELGNRGVAGDTYDDPTEGALDRITNKQSNMQLNAATERLARGIQSKLGKSDNDAKLADKMAIGTGSGADRVRAAHTAKSDAVQGIRAELSTLPSAQQQQLLMSLPAEVKDAVLGR